MPPPGAYNVVESVSFIKSRHSVGPGILSSQASREIFKGISLINVVDKFIPSPADYLPCYTKRQIRVQTAGAFLSSGARFEDGELSNIPGPGTYEEGPSTLLKKTFNATFES